MELFRHTPHAIESKYDPFASGASRVGSVECICTGECEHVHITMQWPSIVRTSVVCKDKAKCIPFP